MGFLSEAPPCPFPQTSNIAQLSVTFSEFLATSLESKYTFRIVSLSECCSIRWRGRLWRLGSVRFLTITNLQFDVPQFCTHSRDYRNDVPE